MSINVLDVTSAVGVPTGWKRSLEMGLLFKGER